MKNNIQDLQHILFEQIQNLADPEAEKPVTREELDKVKAINELAKSLIETDKLQLEHTKLVNADKAGNTKNGFLAEKNKTDE